MVVGSPPRIVVLDLGLAALLRQRAPAVQVLRHLDPRTTAPEVLAGAAPDPRSDVYSLGAVAHRLLTGYLPDRGVAGGPATTAAGALPAAVRAVLDTALAPAPADRLGVRALAAALAAAIPLPYTPAAVRPPVIARSSAHHRRNASRWAGAAWTRNRAQVAALGLALSAALLWIVGTGTLTLRSSSSEAVRQELPDAAVEDEESGNVSDQPPATEPPRPAVRPTAPREPDASKQPRPVAVRRPMLLPGQRESSDAELEPEPDVGPEPAADVVTDVSPAPTPTVPEPARDSTALPTDPEPADEPAAPDATRDAMLAHAAASQAIGQVARAVEARDLVALRLALPELTDEARTGWAQLFEVARDLRATLTVRDVVVRGVLADAQVAGTYEFWNRSLNRWERVPILAQATLVRDVGGWRMSAWR
jgi:hypothetical protein